MPKKGPGHCRYTLITDRQVLDCFQYGAAQAGYQTQLTYSQDFSLWKRSGYELVKLRSVVALLHACIHTHLHSGKFLPFKTPLGPRYNSQIPEECQFNISMLTGYVESLGMRLGMVVDLTKTDRFYDKRDLQEMGVGHYKLKCEGYVPVSRCTC